MVLVIHQPLIIFFLFNSFMTTAQVGIKFKAKAQASLRPPCALQK